MRTHLQSISSSKMLPTYLSVPDTKETARFYKKAFNAEEINRRISKDGTSLVSSSLKIGESILICSQDLNSQKGDATPPCGGDLKKLNIHVDSIDRFFQKAIEQGCIIKQPLTSTVVGGRQGKLIDPYGCEWSIIAKNFQLDDEEISKITQQIFKQYLY